MHISRFMAQIRACHLPAATDLDALVERRSGKYVGLRHNRICCTLLEFSMTHDRILITPAWFPSLPTASLCSQSPARRRFASHRCRAIRSNTFVVSGLLCDSPPTRTARARAPVAALPGRSCGHASHNTARQPWTTTHPDEGEHCATATRVTPYQRHTKSSLSVLTLFFIMLQRCDCWRPTRWCQLRLHMEGDLTHDACGTLTHATRAY